MNVPFSHYITPFVEAYQLRTGRADGLDIIRDTLAKYGAQRMSDLSGEEAMACLQEIVHQLEHST